MAQPFFIVSSGRSGTAMLAKALGSDPAVTIEHEYMVHLVQPLAVQRYHGLADTAEAQRILSATHGAAIHYASAELWGDSSNKLSWLIPELATLFPEARFVHLLRDGRKVASSFFHKLADECYDDRSSKILTRYLGDPAKIPAPPPEKKYWWPQPKPDDPWEKKFSTFTQFERIAWHWAEINRTIFDGLASVPMKRKLLIRLEDLRSEASAVARLFAFLGRPYRDAHFAVFARPHNVNRPVDTPLTAEQSKQFERIAGSMQSALGYADRPEYAVNYGSS